MRACTSNMNDKGRDELEATLDPYRCHIEGSMRIEVLRIYRLSPDTSTGCA